MFRDCVMNKKEKRNEICRKRPRTKNHRRDKKIACHDIKEIYSSARAERCKLIHSSVGCSTRNNIHGTLEGGGRLLRVSRRRFVVGRENRAEGWSEREKGERREGKKKGNEEKMRREREKEISRKKKRKNSNGGKWKGIKKNGEREREREREMKREGVGLREGKKEREQGEEVK